MVKIGVHTIKTDSPEALQLRCLLYTISKSMSSLIPKFLDGALCGLNGEVYIRIIDRQRELDAANEAAKDDDSRVFSEGDIEQQVPAYRAPLFSSCRACALLVSSRTSVFSVKTISE